METDIISLEITEKNIRFPMDFDQFWFANKGLVKELSQVKQLSQR